jgi:hypothetical protein
MTTGRWRARRAAGVTKAPETVQHRVLERLACEACLFAQQLLQLVCPVVLVERIVLQDRQCSLVRLVGNHVEPRKCFQKQCCVVVCSCWGRAGWGEVGAQAGEG